ncbi:MAG: hypothetical protein ACFFDN_37535 [Candidatus Hodarchaeota archaeon]
MSEKDKFLVAKRFMSLGQMEKTSAILWEIYDKTKNSALKLQIILGLIVALNQAKDNDKLHKICIEGIKLANSLAALDAKAYLMAKKAHCLLVDFGFNLYKRKNLVLTPEWKGFALESEEKEYKNLTEKIIKSEKEADLLLDDSLKFVEKKGSKDAKANVLMFKGEIFAEKYLNYKMENMKLTKLRLFFKNLTSKDYFFFDKEDRKKLKEYLSICRKSFLESASIYKSIGDESGEALSFLNLANYLNSANRSNEVNKYLSKAKKIAQKHKDVALLNRIDELEKSIKMRTVNKPHFFNREDRA